MAFIIRTAKTLRNHWKKSTFAALALAYGTNYANNRFETQKLMLLYCQKAREYGNRPIPVQDNPRNLIVILNPNANKRKATDDFENYCAPLLHLAGICVDIIKTEAEGQAKELVNKIKEGTSALVVAGGDGTLCEVVTGLLRNSNEKTEHLVPLGVLPLGRSNSLASSLFPGGEKLAKIKSLANATMAIIEECTRPIDIIKIEATNEQSSNPVYAVNGIEWGAYRDADVRRDSYWYFGRFRNYVTYIFSGLKSNITWKCEANLQYTPPCNGCSNCYLTKASQKPSSWLNRFAPVDKEDLKYLQISNPECSNVQEIDVSTTDLIVKTQNSEPKNGTNSKITINLGPNSVGYIEFVKEGWKSENGEKRRIERTIEARTVNLQPKTDTQDQYYSIDNDNFELKPIRISLLPNIIKVFCTKGEHTL